MLFIGKDEVRRRQLEKIKEAIKKDGRFTRQAHSEAFADNFPRMYGYGVHISSALKKFSDDLQKSLKSRYSSEHRREEAMISIIRWALDDVHKTDLHRIHAIVREYKEDMEDPNIPEPVKKNIKTDMEEVEKLLDQYKNSYSELQNRINKLILEELYKMDIKEYKKQEKNNNIKDAPKEEKKEEKKPKEEKK